MVWTSDADSCARVTAYCSLRAVGYDISCGGSDPLGHMFVVNARARKNSARRGLRDSACRDFRDWTRKRCSREWPARHQGKRAMTVLTWTDDRVEQLKKLW